MSDAARSERSVEEMLRRWRSDDPQRVVGRGHPVGDFLEAHEWEVLERGEKIVPSYSTRFLWTPTRATLVFLRQQFTASKCYQSFLTAVMDAGGGEKRLRRRESTKSPPER